MAQMELDHEHAYLKHGKSIYELRSMKVQKVQIFLEHECHGV
jgi:hypothetical protein